MTIVPDTSPLILLAKIGRLDLLSTLYDEIVLPKTVLAEIREKQRPDTAAIHRWRDQQAVRVRPETGSAEKGLPSEIGPGERGVIALGLRTNADLVILDDREARRIARTQGLQVTGTIGVLVEARAQNHLSSFSEELDRLVEAGLWISDAFYERLIQEFEESS